MNKLSKAQPITNEEPESLTHAKDVAAQEVAEGSEQYAKEQAADLEKFKAALEKELLAKLQTLKEDFGVRAQIFATNIDRGPVATITTRAKRLY